MEIFIRIIGMFLFLIGVLFIFLKENNEKTFFKILGCFFICLGTLMFFEKIFINIGAENFYKHPKNFKIEIKYELKNSVLTPVDTIVKENLE